jgi:hypothetical protein
MSHYAQQLNPIMSVLIHKGYDGLSPSGGYFERALYHGTLKGWEDQTALQVVWDSDKTRKKPVLNITPGFQPSP